MLESPDSTFLYVVYCIYSLGAETSSICVSVESAALAVWYHMPFGSDESAAAARISVPAARFKED